MTLTPGEMMATIYCAVTSWNYEGSSLDAVYTDKKAAMNHRFNGGDDQEMRVFRSLKNGQCKRIGTMIMQTGKIVKDK